ncbi:MAG: glycosyltransferase [Bacillota bacterium]
MKESFGNGSENSIKVAFFVKQGLDEFIGAVIDALNGWFETKKIVVAEQKQIDAGMEWADVCWFEWCDELVIYASRHVRAVEKKIICRLHSYEAFTDYPGQVNWEMVDLLVFVAGHIRDIVTDKNRIDPKKTIVVPNAIDTEEFSFRPRSPGFKIAFAGYINYKKGPMLLLHTFKAIHDTDSRYTLYLAGLFQDERDLLYFKQMIGEWGLGQSVFFDGWQEDLDSWLEDKDYILCTSILESQNISVMQAMAKGIKPLIHNFVGARSIYSHDLIFNTIPEAVAMLGGAYDSNAYREFIQTRYGREKIADRIRDAVKKVAESGTKLPLVSVVMAVYNREKYVQEAMKSVLSQSYGNIELIVVNDGSTDGSEAAIQAVRDDRVRYFAIGKSGQLPALQYGFSMAEGKFVARVDSDDSIHRDYIAACVEAMTLDTSLDFVYSDFQTIDDKGKTVGEIHFKDYSTPLQLILDVFTTFSSVIPDTAFWRKEYMEYVLFNYTGENVPFYIDNILECRYGHIKNPMYHYRQHDSNYAAEPGNLRIVMEGKIKCIDILIKKYFIQMDITEEFRENRQAYFRLFTQYFTVLAQAYENAGKGIAGMFADEAAYWQTFAPQGDGDKNGERAPEKTGALLENVRNRRVLLASTDDPRQGRAAMGKKHTHIHLLMKGLEELMIPCFFTTYTFDPVTTVDGRLLAKEWGVPENLLSSRDSAFAFLVYAVQKQLEQRIERRLRASFVSCISCQDVIAVHAAHSVMSRMHMEIPLITTLHGCFTFENTDYGLINANSAVYDFFLEYEKTAYAVSNRILAVETRIRDYVLGMMGNKAAQKTSVLKNAVDDDLFCTDPEDKGFFDDNIIFVRPIPETGVMEVVKAARELLKRGGTEFKFVIAGVGAQREEVKKYVDEHGLKEHVELLGNVPHDKILPLYQAARVVVIPSEPANSEATLLSVLEAMSCGRVVVACGTGGLKELIDDGESGYLMDSADPAGLADVITKVFEIDFETYAKIAQNARRTVEAQYGYRPHTQKYVEVFDACCREEIAGTGNSE